MMICNLEQFDPIVLKLFRTYRTYPIGEEAHLRFIGHPLSYPIIQVLISCPAIIINIIFIFGAFLEAPVFRFGLCWIEPDGNSKNVQTHTFLDIPNLYVISIEFRPNGRISILPIYLLFFDAVEKFIFFVDFWVTITWKALDETVWILFWVRIQ